MADTQTPHRISTTTAFFMIVVAVLLDLIQFVFTLFVITSLLSELVTFFALCVFGVWFAILGVNYFSGKKVGLKLASVFTSAIVELVPLIDGLPAITAGVVGIIVSVRKEDAQPKPGSTNTASNHIRFGTQKIPSPANDQGGRAYQEAA